MSRTAQQITSDAVARYKRERERGLDWEWTFGMDEGSRKAFESYLVSTADPLAFVPGTAEWRFKSYVRAHVPVEWNPAETTDAKGAGDGR